MSKIDDAARNFKNWWERCNHMGASVSESFANFITHDSCLTRLGFSYSEYKALAGALAAHGLTIEYVIPEDTFEALMEEREERHREHLLRMRQMVGDADLGNDWPYAGEGDPSIRVGRLLGRIRSSSRSHISLELSVRRPCTQERFEQDLRRYCDIVFLFEPMKTLILHGGGTLRLPDWFHRECRQNGVEIEFSES